MVAGPSVDDLFERRMRFPDAGAKERFDRLMGLDEHKDRLSKMLGILVNPENLLSWFHKHHPGSREIVKIVLSRPPLLVLAGDVGTGKTELAETVGDAVARQEKIDITLFPLSLSTRGQGRVGEMTQLISAAFEHTYSEAGKLRSSNGRNRGAVLLLVDEADALAQSREAAQMHHEDRAGVNAFIRGVDRIASAGLPAAVIMCTNRLGALDPAIRRRAADTLQFTRPDKMQRYSLLHPYLNDLGFADDAIRSIAATTGATGGREYGFTYSDLMQRLLPTIVLDAYPEQPVNVERALKLAEGMAPTAPFTESTA